MFSSVERKPVDRFPFCTYNCHGFPWGSHGADPGYRPILDQIDATSAGVLFTDAIPCAGFGGVVIVARASRPRARVDVSRPS